MSFIAIVLAGVLLVLAVGVYFYLRSDTPLKEEVLQKIYQSKLPAPGSDMRVFHLGHSLVGRDMPAMLQQLRGGGHSHRSQLGWGATLKSHWEPDVPINGFETENAHPNYQDVFEAIDGQSFDAFVLTEMVEIKDAIKYFDSSKYLARFAERLTASSPDTRIFLYESWHHVTDEEGWIYRLDNDYGKYWLTKILDKAIKRTGENIPIYVIPVGQVMSALFKRVEQQGGTEGLRKPEDIFATKEDGSQDGIHLNDIGAYLVALVHYAVLYQASPAGLPRELTKANGEPASPPTAEAARLMQEVAWDVVSANYRTGLKTFSTSGN